MEDVGAVLSLTEKKNGSGSNETSLSTGEEAEPGSQAREIALEGISFQANPGQLVALVGPSGAGKTTLTYLIPRLYDPTGGRILIDRHDLRDVTLDSLAGAIGMVTQETYLFHDTIRTNLLYARPEAAQEEVEAAARAATSSSWTCPIATIRSWANGATASVAARSSASRWPA
jgi:ATP-binding cassette subfamily B protein